MKPMLCFTLLVGTFLAACGGGGGGAAPGNPPPPGGSAPATGTPVTGTPVTGIPGTVMNLHAEFSMEQPYLIDSVTGTSTIHGESKITVKGTLDRWITVEETANGHVNFYSVEGHPAKLTAVVEHSGNCMMDSPDDSSVRRVEGQFSFSGAVTDEQLSYGLRSSRQGAGDELSFRISYADLTGSESTIYTLANGNKVAMPDGCAPIVLVPSTHQINPSPTTRQYSNDWIVFPAISGPAPTDPIDAMMRKHIDEHPEMHFTGLTTSSQRQEWRYKGTRYLIPRTPGKPDRPQHLDVVWRLEPV